MTDSQRLLRMDEFNVSSDQKEQILARELDDTFVDYQTVCQPKHGCSIVRKR